MTIQRGDKDKDSALRKSSAGLNRSNSSFSPKKKQKMDWFLNPENKKLSLKEKLHLASKNHGKTDIQLLIEHLKQRDCVGNIKEYKLEIRNLKKELGNVATTISHSQMNQR
jgi:tRNA nucleotidyltransferase/poly(A) polymerase